MARLTSTTIYGSANVTGNTIITGNTFISSGAGLVVGSGNTGVTNIYRSASGSGYTSLPTITIAPPTTFGGVTATANSVLFASTATVQSGGTGYNVGGVITVVGGTVQAGFSNATYTITGVLGGGIISSVTPQNFAAYTILPTNPVSVTGGSGSSATLNLTYGIAGLQVVTNPGSGYVESPTITLTGGGGSGGGMYAVIGNATANVKSLATSLSLFTAAGENVRITDRTTNGALNRYLSMGGGIAGSVSPYIGTGGGTEVLDIFSSTNSIAFSTGGSPRTTQQFNILHTSSSVNWLQVTGNTTGNSPILQSVGSDTNIGINIVSKGNGSTNVRSTAVSTSNTSGALVVSGGMGITGNVFMSAANNYATSSQSSYRLGWTDNYFQRSFLYGGMIFQGNYFTLDAPVYLESSRSLFIRGTINGNDTTNNVVVFAGSSPVRLQNTAPSTSIASGALIVDGGAGIAGNVYIGGNLVIAGNTVTQNVQSLAVADPLIKLGIGNYTSDLKDIGFAAHYNDGTNAHTGIIRDSGTKEYYVFKGYTPELDSNNNVILTDPSFQLANLNADIVRANLVANNIIVRGTITDDQGNNTVIFGGSSPVLIQNGTASTSNTTGALVVSGGVGVSGNTFLNNSLAAVTTTSAVNYLQVTGNTTSNGPVLSAEGTDTNIDINIRPKGIGRVNVFSSGISTFLNVINPIGQAVLNVTAGSACTRSQIITFAPSNGSEANLLIYTTGVSGLPPATAKISSATGKSTIQVEGGQSASMNIITLGISTGSANLQIRSGIGGSFSGDAGILVFGKTNSLKLLHTGTGAGSRFDMGGDSGSAGDFATANITSSLVDGTSSLRVIGGNRADFKLSANGASGFTSFDVESIGTSTNPVYANVSSTFGGVNVQILGAQAGGFAGFANMRMFARSTANLTIESGSSGLTPGASLKIFGNGAPAYANIGSTTSVGSQVNIISSLPSTSNSTGALVVSSGVGVSGNVYADAVYSGGQDVLATALAFSIALG